MKKNRYPIGWNEARVQRVLGHFEKQTDGEAAAEDDAMFSGRRGTVMVIPKRLVPQVRKLIAQNVAKTTWRSRKSVQG